MITLNLLLTSIIEKLNKSVKTDAMVLTAEQKTQVRANIGALGEDYVPPTQTAEQVGADPKGTASTAVTTHNSAADAHNDIRLLIQALSDDLNAFLDVDDETMDELSEVLQLINNNKGTLESLTTSKVNVADIIDNLVTVVANKPLSANQGVVIKDLIDDLTITVEGKPDLSDAEIEVLSKLIQ